MKRVLCVGNHFYPKGGSDRYLIVNYVYNNAINLYLPDANNWISISDEDETNGDFINPEELDSNLDILYSNYSSGDLNIVRRYSNIKTGNIFAVDLIHDLMDSSPSVLKVPPYTTDDSNLFLGLKNGKILLIALRLKLAYPVGTAFQSFFNWSICLIKTFKPALSSWCA